MEKEKYLKLAINLAEKSLKKGGFPVGAVVVKDNKVISEGLSLGGLKKDPTGHAEICAIRKACKKLEQSNLDGATLYTSLEPCFMCLFAAKWAGIKNVVFAARKTQEMVNKNYYESFTDIQKMNKDCALGIALECLSGFEEEILNLIKS